MKLYWENNEQQQRYEYECDIRIIGIQSRVECVCLKKFVWFSEQKKERRLWNQNFELSNRYYYYYSIQSRLLFKSDNGEIFTG